MGIESEGRWWKVMVRGAKRSNGRESGDPRAGIHGGLSSNERMTAYLEEDRETLLLELVWGWFAELAVESSAFS
jgi:hypothetical protein